MASKAHRPVHRPSQHRSPIDAQVQKQDLEPRPPREVVSGSYLESYAAELETAGPAQASELRLAYQQATSRRLETDLAAEVQGPRGNEVMAGLLGGMSLRDKLDHYETGTSMANLLEAASPAELQAITTASNGTRDRSVLMKLEAVMTADAYLDARILLFPEDREQAVSDRVRAADGVFDDEGAAMAAFSKLSVPQRRALIEKEPELASYLTRTEQARFRRLARSESEGLEARMLQATRGPGTDDPSLPGLFSDVARLRAEQEALRSAPETAETRAQLELMGEVTERTSPRRHPDGGLVETSFLGRLRGDVGAETFVQQMRMMGLPQLDVSKQQVLDAMARLNDDERGVREAFAALPLAERETLWSDPHVQAALQGLTVDERVVLQAFRDGDRLAMASQRVRDAQNLIGQDEAATIQAVLDLDVTERQVFRDTELYRSAWKKMDPRERTALDEALATGSLSLETGLHAGAGRRLDGTNKSLMELAYTHRSAETAVQIRRGYVLDREGSVPSRPDDIYALQRFRDAEGILTRELGPEEFQDHLDQLMGATQASEAIEFESDAGRATASAAIDLRADDRMGRDGRGGGGLAAWFSDTDETAVQSHQSQKAARRSAGIDGVVDPGELHHHSTLGAVFEQDFSEMVHTQKQVSQVASMAASSVAVVVATLASGGTLGTVAMSFMLKYGGITTTAALAATTIGTKELFGGDRYQALGADGARDGTMAVLEALTGRATGALGDRIVGGFAGRIPWLQRALGGPGGSVLGHVLESGANAGVGVVQDAVQQQLLSEAFWNQHGADMLQSILDGSIDNLEQLPVDLVQGLLQDLAVHLAVQGGERLAEHLREPEPATPHGLLDRLPAPKVPEDPIERGEFALSRHPPDPEHPYMQQLEALRAALEAEGLPSSAEGVLLHIVDMAEHGDSVSRAAAGEAGPGRGALVHQYEVLTLVDSDEVQRRYPRPDYGVQTVGPHHDAVAMLDGVVMEEAHTQAKRTMVLDHLTDAKLAEGRQGTEFVNMSWGGAIATERRLGEMLDVGRQHGTPFARTLGQLVGPIDHQVLMNPLHPCHLVERRRVAALLMVAHDRRVASGPYAESASQARVELDEALSDSREAGLLTFVAAGNGMEGTLARGLPPQASRSDVVGFEGLLSVGATNEHDWSVEADDTVAQFSSADPDFVAPGVDLPISSQFAVDTATETSGTSFASPYAVGVAALMSKANPDLTPGDIAAMMTNPSHLKDVAPGTLFDGGGEIKPLDLVRAARDADS